MEMKLKTADNILGTLLASSALLGSISALMAVWRPPGRSMLFLAVGHPGH